MPYGIDGFQPLHVSLVLDDDAGTVAERAFPSLRNVVKSFVQIGIHGKQSAAGLERFTQVGALPLLLVSKQNATMI